MQLKIRNFGPIKSADLDLGKNFILIVGQNNIGKSYAISLVYAILKSFNRFRRSRFYYYLDENEGRPPSEVRKISAQLQSRISSNSSRDVNITAEIINLFKSQISGQIIIALQQTLNGTFSDVGNLQNRRSQDPLQVTLEDEEFLLDLGVDNGQLIVNQFVVKNQIYTARKVRQNRSIKQDSRQTIIYFPEGNPQHFEASINILLLRISTKLVGSVCGSVFDLHYLPASRSGLYQSLSAFGQIVAELSKSRTGLRQKIELPGISEPLSDYFLKLSDVRTTTTEADNLNFKEIARKIEEKILHGTVEFESKTRRILFKPTGIDLSLDLSATSSMVSEISPIASYLKYVLPRSQSNIERTYKYDKNQKITQLLILEEPEAHLHPDVQVKLIEILATLSLNAKIILTSHSNYIFNKCSNLIISKKLKQDEFEAIIFEYSDTGSITRDLNVNQYGISDENFGETGENLFEERRKLILDIHHD